MSVIRTETVLSKLPIHNLAKRGRINIEIKKKNDRGLVDLRWEVSYNERYGQPRQLAYKLDTLLVNRRIEEAGRPLPKVIRLGGLREICKELEMSEGEATLQVKKAIHQNAGTYITAKLSYKGTDGAERTLEAGFTRYNVVFTGERLPDGRKADAVFLILNKPYWEVLNNAPFRPLDYDYLKELSPAPQRFYEVISYRIFAALKHKHPHAKITYSDYCTFSAQQRYFDYDHFKKQMYKVHRPHMQSGLSVESKSGDRNRGRTGGDQESREARTITSETGDARHSDRREIGRANRQRVTRRTHKEGDHRSQSAEASVISRTRSAGTGPTRLRGRRGLHPKSETTS